MTNENNNEQKKNSRRNFFRYFKPKNFFANEPGIPIEFGNVPPSIEKHDEKVITRRNFLKLMTVLGFTGFTYKVYKVISQDPEFARKVFRSFQEGKAIEDIQEIIESRLHFENNHLNLNSIDAESKYSLEEWMLEVVESVKILEITQEEKEYPMLLFDITNTTFVISATKREGRIGGSSSLNTIYYDLGDALINERALSLPGPQFSMPSQETGKVLRYVQYNMYAWSDKNKDNRSALSISNSRGGVVLLKDGRFLVASPDEFSRLHDDGELKPEASQEFAFIIDSNDLEASFETMRKASEGLLKDIEYSSTSSNCFITIYQQDNSYKTYLLASYNPDIHMKPNSTERILNMNPRQLALIVEQLKEKLGGTRFVIGITDPSPTASNVYAPWRFTEEELEKKGYDFLKEPSSYTDWMKELGVLKTYFRTVGSQDNFAFPRESFPWVLGTKNKQVN